MTLINVLTTSVLKTSAKEDKGAIVLRTRILFIAHLPVYVAIAMCFVKCIT